MTLNLPSAEDPRPFSEILEIGTGWKARDLAEMEPWEEASQSVVYRGWVLPDYKDFSLLSIPWEDIRRHRVYGPWRQIKKASRRRVIAWQSDSFQETLYIKWVQIQRWNKTLGGMFRSSKVARECNLARRLLAAGFLTPTPILVAERREGPVLREAFLVTRGLEAPDWIPAHALWSRWRAEKEGGSLHHTHALLTDLALAIRDAHDRGYVHDDCRSIHWLARGAFYNSVWRSDPSSPAQGPLSERRGQNAFQASPTVPPIRLRWATLDLDASRLGSPPATRTRRRLLAQMAASFPETLWNSQDSLHFIQSYFRNSSSKGANSEITRHTHAVLDLMERRYKRSFS